MEVIAENRLESDVDGEAADQPLQSQDEPLPAMRVIFARERIFSQQVRSTDASLPTVKDSRSSWPDDLPARTGSHGPTPLLNREKLIHLEKY
jgi:hypothetical protein